MVFRDNLADIPTKLRTPSLKYSIIDVFEIKIISENVCNILTNVIDESIFR